MNLEPADPSTPVPPGCIRIVRLQEEGRLQSGDQVQTARLGVCTVAYIQGADSICVKTQCGSYRTLSGIAFRAQVVDRTCRDL